MTQFRKCGGGTTACSEKPVSQVHVKEDAVTAFLSEAFPGQPKSLNVPKPVC